jgi:hypothetical protein
MNKCLLCEAILFPELFEQEIICTCGALLSIQWEEDGPGYNVILTEVIRT